MAVSWRSADLDLARRRWRDLRNRDREHAVGQIRDDAIAVDLLGELEHPPEGAVPALDLVIVHRITRRRPRFARALDRQTRILDARGSPGHG